MTILPDVQTAIFDKLGTITEKLATLEERTQWSKTLVVAIFLAIGGGLVWSGAHQYQLGAISEANKNNATQISKLITAVEQQTKDIGKLSDFTSSRKHEVAYTSMTAKYTPAYSTNIMQAVTLTTKSKVAGQKSLYRVPSLIPVTRYNIQQIWVALEKPIPGIAISVRLDDTEKNWDVEIVGKMPMLWQKHSKRELS